MGFPPCECSALCLCWTWIKCTVKLPVSVSPWDLPVPYTPEESCCSSDCIKPEELSCGGDADWNLSLVHFFFFYVLCIVNSLHLKQLFNQVWSCHVPEMCCWNVDGFWANSTTLELWRSAICPCCDEGFGLVRSSSDLPESWSRGMEEQKGWFGLCFCWFWQIHFPLIVKSLVFLFSWRTIHFPFIPETPEPHSGRWSRMWCSHYRL